MLDYFIGLPWGWIFLAWLAVIVACLMISLSAFDDDDDDDNGSTTAATIIAALL